MAAAELDGHMIVATSALDFAAKYYSHELGIHRYCLPLKTQREGSGKR
jgi:hypothetical protein